MSRAFVNEDHFVEDLPDRPITVTIVRDDGHEQRFGIVGEDEADPANGTVSHASPLASALLGKTVGEVVRAGQGEAEIIAIK